VILDPVTEKGAHALERLGSSMAAWLTTVTEDGQPQSLPVWFIRADNQVIVYSDHRARRNRNLEANPRVSFHLPDEGHGGDIVTFEATAEIDPEYPPAAENAAYLAKYGALIDATLGGPVRFSQTYSIPIRISLTRAIVFQG